MSVAYRSTCRPTIGQPLSVDISTDISVECQSTYQPMLDRYVGRYIERHISVDISTDTRPICRPTYRSTLGRYVNRYVGRLLVDMSTDMSVEGCTKYTWSVYSMRNPVVYRTAKKVVFCWLCKLLCKSYQALYRCSELNLKISRLKWHRFETSPEVRLLNKCSIFGVIHFDLLECF